MSLEERIWIENIRWDTIKSESFSGSDAEMAIQLLWSIYAELADGQLMI